MDSVGLHKFPDTKITFQHHYVKNRLMMRTQNMTVRRRCSVRARFSKDNSFTVASNSGAHSLYHCFRILEDNFHVFRMPLK